MIVFTGSRTSSATFASLARTSATVYSVIVGFLKTPSSRSRRFLLDNLTDDAFALGRTTGRTRSA